jgi:hypothetical protein
VNIASPANVAMPRTTFVYLDGTQARTKAVLRGRAMSVKRM